MMHDPATLVLGGGPAGSLFACTLARAGRPVTLVEKSKAAHDKVCGEFLSPEALLYLQQFGLHPNALGAMPVRRLRLVTPWFQRETALPFQAWSMTRRCLDEALLQQAEREGAEVLRGAHVTALAQTQGHWSVLLQDGRRLQSHNVALATGKLDVSGWPRPKPAAPRLVAFKMYYRLAAGALAATQKTIELVLFPGGYAGLQLVQKDVANLCLVIETDKLQECRNAGMAVLPYILQLSSHLHDRLSGALELLPAPLAASSIPYGHVQRDTEPGLWRVGDQAAVIPSFCGDGTAMALHSGALAARCFLQGTDSALYQHTLHDQFSTRMQCATWLSRFVLRHPKASYAVQVYPGMMRHIAGLTRIPTTALRPWNGLQESEQAHEPGRD